jgi:hypothetical protein
MGYKKELSKCCGKCGVEWLKDLSNKQPKRALCLQCFIIESEERKENIKKIDYGRGENRMEKYRQFKISNRSHIYKEVNKRLKPLKRLEDIREFMRIRFDELLAETALWDYINDTDIENKNK